MTKDLCFENDGDHRGFELNQTKNKVQARLFHFENLLNE